MNKHYTILIALFFLSVFTSAQTVLINPDGDGGFENGSTFAGNGWTEVNGSQLNKWFTGAAGAPSKGTVCAYISDNALGATYTHYFYTSSVTYFYRSVTFPPSDSTIQLSFKWKNFGGSADYVQAFLVQPGTPINAGTLLTGGSITRPLFGQTSWQNDSVTLPCSVAGTTKLLVFAWVNDAFADWQPPGAIDEVSLKTFPGVPACGKLLGNGSRYVLSLPFNSGPGSTCGTLNDLNDTNLKLCGSPTAFSGQDQVFVFTPSTSGVVSITLNSTINPNCALSLFEGCPLTSSCGKFLSGQCLTYFQEPALQKKLSFCVTAGLTYYLVLDNQIGCFDYSNLSISAPAPPPADCSAALGAGVINVPSLPYSSGAGSTCGKGNELFPGNAVSCGDTKFLVGEDEIYTFTPSVSGIIKIQLNGSGSLPSPSLTLYKDCPMINGCPGITGGSCVAGVQDNSGSKTLFACVQAGSRYYLVLDVGDPTGTCASYSDLTISAPAPDCITALGTGVKQISSLPYSSGPGTTCGKINDMYDLNTLSCAQSNFQNGEEEVFVFTPAASGLVKIFLSSSAGNASLTLFKGCPTLLSCGGIVSGQCVGFSGSLTGNVMLSACLTAGETYYLLLDKGTVCSSYSDLIISAPVSDQSAALGTGTVNVPSLPFSSGPGSTCGKLNDIGGGNSSCISDDLLSGEDEVFVFKVPQQGQVKISLSTGGSQTTLALYDQYPIACLGGTTGACIAYSHVASGNNSLTLCLDSGKTYYLVLDSQDPPYCNSYSDLTISAPVHNIDLSAHRLILPSLVTNPSMSSPVSFVLKNTGCITISKAVLGYELEGYPTVKEPWSGLLKPGDSTAFTFSTPIPPGANNLLKLKLWTEMAYSIADINPSNDSLDCFILFTLPTGTASNYGKDFWVAFMSNNSSSSVEQTLYLTSGSTASFLVTTPAAQTPISPIAGIIKPNTIVSVPIPYQAGNTLLSSSNFGAVAGSGIHITSDENISVVGFSHFPQTTDGYLALPESSLGTDYLIVAPFDNQEFLVLAAKDNTLATINPPGAAPFSVSLNAGQTYMFSVSDIATVSADKPVSVYAGSVCTNIRCAYCDHVIEQMPPVTSLGKFYYTTDFAFKPGVDIIRLMSASAGATNYTVNGVPFSFSGKGQYRDHDISGPTEIASSEALYALQMCTGGECAPVSPTDPFIVSLVPSEQWGMNYSFPTPTKGFSKNYTNIIKKSAQGIVILDGKKINPADFQQIGSTDFYATQQEVGVGSHIVTGDSAFICYVYGFDNADSYGYPASGSAFKNLETVPLSLLSFLAIPQSDHILLKWDQALVEEVQEMQIERSGEGISFTKIGTLSEKKGITSYSFPDHSVVPGKTYYYRLSKVLNGKTEHSQVIRASLRKNAFPEVKILSNPFFREAQISYSLQEDAEVSISLFNVYGSEIAISSAFQRSGDYQFTISAEAKGLRPGIYFLRFSLNGEVRTFKLACMEEKQY